MKKLLLLFSFAFMFHCSKSQSLTTIFQIDSLYNAANFNGGIHLKVINKDATENYCFNPATRKLQLVSVTKKNENTCFNYFFVEGNLAGVSVADSSDRLSKKVAACYFSNGKLMDREEINIHLPATTALLKNARYFQSEAAQLIKANENGSFAGPHK